jgi:hypothetical protein
MAVLSKYNAALGDLVFRFEGTLERFTGVEVRHVRVDEGGSVSLRVNGRMHHIDIGRPHARTHTRVGFVVLRDDETLYDHDHIDAAGFLV